MQIERRAAGKPTTNVNLMEDLCQVSVALCETRRSHLGNFGTLIPHVFMTAVLARVGYCLSRERGEARAAHRGEAGAILEVLERAFADGSRETRNVIALSFVSDGELEQFFGDMRPLLGPRLLAQLGGR